MADEIRNFPAGDRDFALFSQLCVLSSVEVRILSCG